LAYARKERIGENSEIEQKPGLVSGLGWEVG
jgi:hypothetical protein